MERLKIASLNQSFLCRALRNFHWWILDHRQSLSFQRHKIFFLLFLLLLLFFFVFLLLLVCLYSHENNSYEYQYCSLQENKDRYQNKEESQHTTLVILLNYDLSIWDSGAITWSSWLRIFAVNHRDCFFLYLLIQVFRTLIRVLIVERIHRLGIQATIVICCCILF